MSISSCIRVLTLRSTAFGSLLDNSKRFARNLRHFSLVLSLAGLWKKTERSQNLHRQRSTPYLNSRHSLYRLTLSCDRRRSTGHRRTRRHRARWRLKTTPITKTKKHQTFTTLTAATVCMRNVTGWGPGVDVAVILAAAGGGPTLNSWYCPFSVLRSKWPCWPGCKPWNACNVNC
jgi:hypothetical protein